MEKNKLKFIDRLILYYFIFQILFLRWLNGASYFSYISIIICGIIFLKVIREKSVFKVKISDVIVAAIYIVVITINVSINGIKPMFINNVYSIGIANIIPILYIFVLIHENYNGFKKFLVNNLFVILNVYFIINIPIIMKQLNYTYFLMRNIERNPMYEDHITGLIGASGTHELTFYWIILILINLLRYSQTRNKIIPILNVSYIIFMFIVSSQNDNTAFFIIFPFIISTYFIVKIINRKKNYKKIIKGFYIILLLIGISVCVYRINGNINNFVNTRVMEKIQQYGNVGRDTGGSDSDEERIALFKTALELGNGYKFGVGIGSIQSYGDPSLPKHFGMSEISLRTYEGGIIYLVILIIVFSHFLNRLCTSITNKNGVISFVIISIYLSFFCMYTMIFRQVFYAFALSIITFIISEQYKISKDSKEIE